MRAMFFLKAANGSVPTLKPIVVAEPAFPLGGTFQLSECAACEGGRDCRALPAERRERLVLHDRQDGPDINNYAYNMVAAEQPFVQAWFTSGLRCRRQ